MASDCLDMLAKTSANASIKPPEAATGRCSAVNPLSFPKAIAVMGAAGAPRAARASTSAILIIPRCDRRWRRIEVS